MKKDNLSTNERTNIRIGKIGIILTIITIIITIIIAYKSCISNEEIAKKSGSFDKPHITFGFGNYEIVNVSNLDTINIIYSSALSDSSLNISSFPFQINNTGQKDAESIKLLIEYPKISSLTIMDSNLLISTAPPITQFRRNFISQKDINLITYQIDQINPGLSITVEEPFRLYKTNLTTHVKLENDLSYTVNVQYSTAFSVTVLAKDLPTQKVNFSFQCVDSQSIDELVKTYVNSMDRKEDAKDFSFFILPEKSNVANKGIFSINDYHVCKKCVFMAYIDDLSPSRDMVVAIYDGQNKLNKLKVFNQKNKFVKDIEY